jgi:hypothetical protein
MRKRLRQFDALTHPFAVSADALVGGVGQVDLLESRHCGVRCLSFAQAVQAQQRRHPFVSGHAVVERILLRTDADTSKNRRVPPYGFSENSDGALARLQLPGHELEESRFAGAVRAEQTGDASANRNGDVIEANHLPVPL